MKLKLHYCLSLLLILLFGSMLTKAQITICTNHATTNNANNTVLFNVANTNSYAIEVSDLSAMISGGLSGTYTFTLLYNSAEVNSTGSTWTQGVVDAGQNGWVLGTTASVTLSTHTAPVPVLSGMSIVIPANDTFGFALSCSATLNYSALTSTGVNVFTAGGGVSILTGDNISWGAATLPATPANYPRGFIGCIGWNSTQPCAGTPTPGNTITSLATACSGQNFTLSLQNPTVGTGVTYQWESSPSGQNTWTQVSGATNPTLTTNISANTDFRAVVTCSGNNGTSTPVTVSTSPFYICYCSPNNGVNLNSLVSNYISNVSITNGSLNNSTSVPGPASYSQFYPVTANTTDTLYQGLQYTLNVTHPYTYYFSQVWIDYNGDGTFSSSEYIPLTTANGGNSTNASATFIVPQSTINGSTGLRVRTYWTSISGGSACSVNGSYETEDYVITLKTPPPCAGAPSGGNASAPAAVCSGSNFNLGVTGYTIGTGITLQWESSPAGVGIWTPITGATNPSYTVSGGITTATDYHLVVTCANGGGTGTSSTAAVSIMPFYGCYCASGATNTADDEIDSVTFNGVVNTISCTTTAPGPGSALNRYSNFSTLGALTSVMQGAFVPFDVKEDECDGATYYSNGMAIFIDFNQNGVFTDPGEKVFVENGTTQGPRHIIGNVAIPINAPVGLTGMRIMVVESTSGSSLTPCLSYGYGETEDYVINITAAPSCSGTPTAGTATGPANVCANSAFTLSDNTFGVASGLTFQWESSPAGVGLWTAITGATDPSYTETAGITTPTDYHLVVTCTNGGGTDVSNTVSVGLSPFYICYCGPNTGINNLNNTVFNYISNVSITNGYLNNPTTNPGSGSYSLYYPSTATTTDTLYQGQQYTLNVDFPYTYYYSSIWIDFNGDGTFSASEFVPMTTANGGNSTTSSGTFTVPMTATAGLTGLRVRAYWQTLGSGQACSTNSSYEVEDYVITIAVPPPCNGVPVAGTASGPASICPNADFNISLAGYPIASGISIQWESSPAGVGIWTPITGATNPTYTVSGGINTPTDFHAIVTCANGGGSDVSNAISTTVNPFYLCYCGPNTGISLSSFSDNYITNVNITNGTLNSSTSTVAPGGYTLFWPTTTNTTDNLFQGQQYTLNVTHPYTYYYSTAWLDMNGDGVFSSNESITLTTANGGNSTNATGSFLIPFSATPGLTGLRVRTYWQTLGAGDACLPNNSYETEDYVITIIAPPGCTGTPVAGTASGPAAVCSGVNFNLGLAGYSVNSGISIQWESSPAGVGVWTPISGATDPIYTVTGGITTATDYHAVVTCANGGATDVSNTVAITINPFLACYCASFASNVGDEEIIGVTVSSMNNPSTCSSTGGTGSMQNQYSNYTTTVTPATVSQGQTVSFSINVGTCGGNYGSGTAIFVDFNQNGDFGDPGEQVYTTPSTTNGPHTVTGTFTVPMSATAGITGMRVINAEGYSGSGITPCLSYGYGETEDYVIDIAQAVACTGTPTAGSVSGPSNACANTAFTMTLSGYSVATGITLQWESSPAGQNTWSQISGATDPIYTVTNQTVATDYHVVVTCNGTSSATSSLLAVAQNLPTQCYCVPTYTNGGSADNIVNVTLGTLTNATSGNPSPYYQDYTSLQLGTLAIPDLTQSQSHNLTLTFAGDPNQYSMVWIDFDQDGVFSTTEAFTNSTNAGSNGITTIAITVPSTATLGQTRMRIRGGDDSQPSNTQACGPTNSSYGETEDYLVNIISSSACPAATGLAVANVGNGTADISWTAATGANGYEYAITTSSTPPSSGTGTTATSVTGATFTAGSQVYYLHVRTDCGSSNFSSWATKQFITNDDASGAVLLTVGGGCTGNPYTNAIATQSTGEVFPSCNNGGTGDKTVWFKFVAPASGAVRVSTDNSPQGTLIDSKVGLFSATNVNNYSTFNIISCDEDGGVVGLGYNSILYATGLTSGTTYYVEVDVYDATTSGGTFCVTVDELSSSMIASGSVSCATSQVPELNTTTYTGWTPLLTSTGQLIALVRSSAGAAGNDFDANLTINTGGVRQVGNQYYLDRNYKINNSTISTPVDVQLFFLNSEMTALQGVDPAATLSNLNVTKQSGTNCEATYVAANGTNTALLQSGNGTINGASWIQVSTSSFSNFYIMSGAWPLAIKLRDISATNVGTRNRVDWNTESELKGDRFEVERSVDGSNFTYMATVNAKGEASAYSYWDEQPVTGVNYYRLKMTDASGKFAYSRTVQATVKEGSFAVEAYPNPVSDVLTVKAYGTSSVNATVTISDAAGKVVKIVTVVNGMAKVNMGGLAQGIYQVKYSDNNHTQTIKVSKQ